MRNCRARLMAAIGLAGNSKFQVVYQFFHVFCRPSIMPDGRVPGTGRGVIYKMIDGSHINAIKGMVLAMGLKLKKKSFIVPKAFLSLLVLRNSSCS